MTTPVDEKQLDLFTEEDLLKGLDEHSAHADELAEPTQKEFGWDEWFDGAGVSENFMQDRQQHKE